MRSRTPQPSPLPSEPSQLLQLPEELFFMNHMPVQCDMGAHHHHSLEIAFLVDGKAMHRTTAGEEPCKRGQVLVIPPGVWHAYAHCQNLELYNCQLSQALLDGILAWATEDPSLGALLNPDPWHGNSRVLTWNLPEAALTRIRGLLSQLLLAYEGSAARGEIVGWLLLVMDVVASKGVPSHAFNTQPIHSAARRAAHLLHADPARAWSLAELAGELRINPSYLIRIFRQATGCAPMKFLARERAHKAAQLLLTSELPISEIGPLVGWEEPKQFARSFRQHYGGSATDFRRRLSRA